MRADCSIDVRARLRVVLDSLRHPTLHLAGERARRIRCIEILAQIGGQDALSLIRAEANGTGGQFEMRLAAEAARRMQASEVCK